jgi:hypothetical protein
VIDDVKQWLPPSSAGEASKMRTNFSLLTHETETQGTVDREWEIFQNLGSRFGGTVRLKIKNQILT